MRVGLITKEWPPNIYGGAGVHALQLTQALQKSITVDVSCFGPQRVDAQGFALPKELEQLNPALQAFATDIEIAQSLGEVDLVHSHTWYANMAGHFASLLHGIPHVITAHSLEPDRPWKAEQLGGGYRLSSWAEKTAYEAADAIIAVSNGMRTDILKAYPALDPTKVHTSSTALIHKSIRRAKIKNCWIGSEFMVVTPSLLVALLDKKAWAICCEHGRTSPRILG